MSLGLALPLLVERPLLATALVAGLAAAAWLIGRRSWAEGSRARLRASLVVRVALFAILALALAGLQWRRDRPEMAVAFAVDSSDSVRGSREMALDVMRRAAKGARPGDRVAVVQFGRDALVERGLTDDVTEPTLASTPRPDGSDVAGALRLARGVLPPDGRRRVVLLTDGDASGDDPTAAVRALRDEGIDVVLAPLSGREGPEVLVDEVAAPERVHEGEPFEVRVVLRASAPARGTLTVTRDGRLVGQAEAEAGPGAPSAFRFVDRADDAGTRLYRAHFDADPDGFEQNDAAEALVRVEGKPSILILDPDPASLEPVVSMLAAAGVKAEVAGPEHLPRTVAEAGRHAAIVLSNVDSMAVSQRQMEALRAYVRETGGGLAMTGGPDSFGPGGWYATPVEDVLPVDMDVRNEKYYPSLTLILAIDKSGSMSGSDGTSKMDLAKEAARQTARLLQQGDHLGVIAFDSAAKVVVDAVEPVDPRESSRLIGTIQAGGGTDIYPALVVAEEKFAASRTALKHLIVLSDGQSPPRDFEAIVRRLAAAKVTTSTVAVGADADMATMKRLADWGRGRFYLCEDPGSIPRIFTKEAFTTARSFVVEEPFVPQVGASHAVLRGALPLPGLGGYVAATAKPAAETALVSHRGDPVLALRTFGLGRTAALTTDLGTRWSPEWLRSPQGRTLLVQLMRWLASRSESPLLEASLERRNGRVVVIAEARDESGGFLNFAELRAGVVGPDQKREDVTLRQVAPGRYEGEVADRGPGAWFAGVVQVSGERMLRGTTAARVFPYSDEYRTLQAPGDALGRLAAASGASFMGEPEALFDRTGPPAVALRPAWRELVLLAACLLLIDVALRRVMLPEGWAAAVGARVRGAFARRRTAPAETEPLTRLRQVKAEARAEAEGATRPVTESPRPPREAEAAPPASAPGASAPAPPSASSPPVATSTPPLPPPPAGRESPEAFRSRLLAAKRRAKSDK